MTLSKNPFYLTAVRHQNRGWVRLAGEGLLACGLLAGGTTAVGRLWLGLNDQAGLGLALAAYALWILVAGLGRGFNAVARERVGRRFELVHCTPMSGEHIVGGMLAAAWRPTRREGLCWGSLLVVLCELIHPALSHPAIAIMGYVVCLSALTTAAGMWMGTQVPNGQQQTLVPTMAALVFFVVGLMGCGLVVMCVPRLEYVGCANPLAFVGYVALGDPTLSQSIGLALVPGSIFLAWTLMVWGGLAVGWERLPMFQSPQATTGLVPAVSTRAIRYTRTGWLRNPYLAVADSRWRRGWSQQGAGQLGEVLLVAFLGWLLGNSSAVAAVACAAGLFSVWAATTATHLVGRDKEPHRLEMVMATGMSIPYLMRSQWIASLYPFGLLVVVFGGLGGWAAALAAVVGTLAGAALGIAGAYRIRLASWRPVLVAVLCLEVVYLTFCIKLVATPEQEYLVIAPEASLHFEYGTEQSYERFEADRETWTLPWWVRKDYTVLWQLSP